MAYETRHIAGTSNCVDGLSRFVDGAAAAVTKEAVEALVVGSEARRDQVRVVPGAQ